MPTQRTSSIRGGVKQSALLFCSPILCPMSWMATPGQGCDRQGTLAVTTQPGSRCSQRRAAGPAHSCATARGSVSAPAPGKQRGSCTCMVSWSLILTRKPCTGKKTSTSQCPHTWLPPAQKALPAPTHVDAVIFAADDHLSKYHCPLSVLCTISDLWGGREAAGRRPVSCQRTAGAPLVRNSFSGWPC